MDLNLLSENHEELLVNDLAVLTGSVSLANKIYSYLCKNMKLQQEYNNYYGCHNYVPFNKDLFLIEKQ